MDIDNLKKGEQKEGTQTNKKRNLSISIIILLVVSMVTIFIPTISAVTVTETAVNRADATTYTSFNGNVFGAIWAFEATTTGYLYSIECHLEKYGTPVNGAIIMGIYNQTGTYGTNSRAGNWIEWSIAPVVQNDMVGMVSYNTFYFHNTTLLTAGTKYVISISPSGALDLNNCLRLGSISNGASYAGDCALYYSGTWNGWSNDIPFAVKVTDTSANTPTVTPTPAPPSGSVPVNFLVNSSSMPNAYGNITWCALQNGTPNLNYVTGMLGDTYYFSDGLSIALKPQLATGWYFSNFTVQNNDGTYIYYTDNEFVMLNSTKGTYNITMGISQTRNTVAITLSDASSSGHIYFQNYLNSVPTGSMYSAGTYNIVYGTTIYISAITNTNVAIDYFSETSNGVTSIIDAGYITFIAETNTTITGHYIYTGSGATGGVSPFQDYWIVIIVYIIFTVFFALIAGKYGLIAGLLIATIITVIAYPTLVWLFIPIIIAVVALLFSGRNDG